MIQKLEAARSVKMHQELKRVKSKKRTEERDKQRTHGNWREKERENGDELEREENIFREIKNELKYGKMKIPCKLCHLTVSVTELIVIDINIRSK